MKSPLAKKMDSLSDPEQKGGDPRWDFHSETSGGYRVRIVYKNGSALALAYSDFLELHWLGDEGDDLGDVIGLFNPNAFVLRFLGKDLMELFKALAEHRVMEIREGENLEVDYTPTVNWLDWLKRGD